MLEISRFLGLPQCWGDFASDSEFPQGRARARAVGGHTPLYHPAQNARAGVCAGGATLETSCGFGSSSSCRLRRMPTAWLRSG